MNISDYAIKDYNEFIIECLINEDNQKKSFSDIRLTK